MAINFKLNDAFELDPALDSMDREWVGWPTDHEPTPEEIYEQNRGVWLLGPRAERERYATFSHKNTVRVVVEIEKLETIPSKHPAGRSKRAVVGRVLHAGDPVHDAFVGQEVDAHRNPVTYLEDPDAGPRVCGCGCGTPVTGSRLFVPGHDQRAVHERITRQWGSTMGFITWFDRTYSNPPTD